MKANCSPLQPCSLGLAFGIIWGLATLIVGLLAMTGYGIAYVKVMGSVYLGYGPHFWGAILGGIWGFFDGLVGGFILAWIYNRCVGACCKAEG